MGYQKGSQITEDDCPEYISFWDSFLSTCNIFILGFGIGVFLTYHYLVKMNGKSTTTPGNISDSTLSKRPSLPSEFKAGLKTQEQQQQQEFMNLNLSQFSGAGSAGGASGGWRDSDPDLASENPHPRAEQISRRRRSSLLYH